jgi:hypothetical protein
MRQIATMASTQEYYAGSTISDYSAQLRLVFSGLDDKRGPRLIE